MPCRQDLVGFVNGLPLVLIELKKAVAEATAFCAMGEDKTRSKNYHLNCNLSALRVCLVALKADLHPESSWPELQERCQHDPHIPFRAFIKHRAK